MATYTRVDISPDLVITDMMMPAMGGLMTIRVLHDINPAVRIIGTSGLGGETEVAAAIKEGARRFLPKPFTADHLLVAIREVLDAE